VNLQTKELLATFEGYDGRPAVLYFDPNYNPTFALTHPDFEKSSRPWENFGGGGRKIKVNVLSPVDLAVSKLSRFSDQDREDILTLASLGLITAEALRLRATEAMHYYIGNQVPLRTNIDLIARAVRDLQPAPPRPPQPLPKPPAGDFGMSM
jgi:hypothetical protein